MESKWYLFPGQTIENTKISDRAHALHITSAAWGNITQHLNRKKRIQEAIDKDQAHREALKQGSHSMTKDWVNSIENLRLKKEEERRDRINRKKEDKVQLFYKMRAEQEVVRKQYVDKIKKEVFISHGYPKELTSAMILSETLHEREKQKEFNESLRKHGREDRKRFDDEILATDERQRQEDQQKKQERFEKERKVAQILKDQITENEETRKAQNRGHVERETRDRINAAEEAELLKQFEIDEKKRIRREIAHEKKKELEAERERHKIMMKENAELEKATEFYSEARKRIECLLKSKEKEMRAELIREREAIASEVAALQEDKDAIEDKRIAKAIAEKDEEDRIKKEAKDAFEAQSIQDRIDDRKQHMKRMEKEKSVDNEMKRWEMLNRCKAAEAIQEYSDQYRRNKWAKVLEYRKDLLDQMAEDTESKKREKEIDEIMSRVSFEESDKMFFEYATEVLELAKRKNRPTYAIEKVIDEYKKVNNLQAKDRHCRCCKK